MISNLINSQPDVGYKNLGSILLEIAEMFKPMENLTVASCAEKYRFVNNPGSSIGPYRIETAPYLQQPMEELSNSDYDTVCFVAGSQSGKTDLILNWLLYIILCDPSDLIVYQMTQTAARDFVVSKLNKFLRDNPILSEKLVKGGNTNKFFSNGSIFTSAWPSITQLSSKSVRRVALTDYDRVHENIDGEGKYFDLARKRTTSFRSKAKTFVESSPGHLVKDTKWIRKTDHEAPPCDGIISIFNRGDRRLYYWRCIYCRNAFVPEFKFFVWPKSGDVVEMAEAAKMKCPHCGKLIDSSYKYDLNIDAVWLKEGQILDQDGTIRGEGKRSKIASFHLKGAQAAFLSWVDLVGRYIDAMADFEKTGSQNALITTVNTEQGDPYFLKGIGEERSASALMDAADKELNPGVVPKGVRFLLASIDVQKNRFCCQVFGISPVFGDRFDVIVIDRFDILKSERTDADGERFWVKPATFVEDWWQIKKQVLDKSYKLDGFNGEIFIRLVCCDSGGIDGVTSNAYEFFRELKKFSPRDVERFRLLKGDSSDKCPTSRITYPDSASKDRHAGAKGEIPVLMLNRTILKDNLNGRLDASKGEGSFVMPSYLPQEVFEEMCVEFRTAKGWEKPKSGRIRNEAWDLGYYCLGMMHFLTANKQRFNWNSPPPWAREWDKNSLVVEYEEEPEKAEEQQSENTTKKLLKKSEHKDEEKALEELRRLASILG